MHALGKRAKGQTFRGFESPLFRQKIMSSNITQDIKDRLNIVDVLSSYIQLKKSGTNYKAECPFHHEKSASLMISPAKQIWHCFGCGEGGDIFGFVMKYENLEFAETLKILADRAGVELPKFTKQNVEQDKYKAVLYKINEWAAKFYYQVLLQSKSSQPARDYLEKRGLTARTIEDWQIGFAPNEFHILESFLAKKDYTAQHLLDAGVSAKSAKGEVYDRFINRITFPIKNYAGEVVGFTARVLDSDAKTAKYINSPETQIYSKSKVIFGLYQAKQTIRKEDFAIVVEGNMDVISAHQAGFTNVVASSGTAFTYDQLQTLSRLTKNLKFAFDTDSAGAAATLRALDAALALGFSVYIVRITGAKDPDELIKKDPKAFAEAVKNAPLYLDYFFEKAFENFDPSSVDAKKSVTAMLVPMLKKLSDPLESAHYTRILAQRLSVPEKTIYELLAKEKPQNFKSFSSSNSANQSGGNASPQVDKTVDPVAPLLKSKSYVLEQKFIGYALLNKEYRDQVIANIIPEALSPEIQPVYQQLLAFSAENQDNFSSDNFIQRLAAKSNGELIDPSGSHAELAKMALFMVESEYHQADNPGTFEKDFQKELKDFLNIDTKLQMQNLISAMIAAEQKQDKQELEQLKAKFLELSQKLAKI